MTNQPNNTPLTPEWKLVPHSSQIADTGDYSGYYEITNGKASFESDLDDDDDLQALVDFLNKDDYRLSTWRGKEEADFAWSQYSQAQSRIAELERERQTWFDRYGELSTKYHSKLDTIETLMGLLEKMVKAQAYRTIPASRTKEHLESDWQSYCKEHNLK